MKLIIQNSRIAATTTDEYDGPDEFIIAPPDFDPERMAEYAYADGVLVLSVPQKVTMRQARLALLGAGLLDDVEAAIAALPSPQKEAARIEWEYSQEVQRHNGFVSVLAPALGMTDEQTDALFVEAAKL